MGARRDEDGVEALRRERGRVLDAMFVSISTPRAVTFSMSRSTTSTGNRYDGMPSRRNPPATGAASKILTAYPSRASCQAAVRPVGAGSDDRDPLPVRLGTLDAVVALARVVGVRAYRLRRRIGSVPSSEPRVQAASHGA